MSSFKGPDLQQRQTNAAEAKKAMLEKFRAASEDPAVAKRQETRAATNQAAPGPHGRARSRQEGA